MPKPKSADIGKYNRDGKTYQKLVNEFYADYPDGVTLPPEYAHYVDRDLIRFLIRLARYKFVARMLKTTDTALEVGCGSGLGSIFLSQHCREVTGLDVKTTEIEEARALSRRKNVSFVVQDLFTLDARLKYDAVVALDVIEHYRIEKGRTLIREMTKHLNSTGVLIIGTPSAWSLPYQSRISRASHIKCYDQKELIQLLENYFSRTVAFSMNDEMVHTGYAKMAWYYFVLAFYPKVQNVK